MWCQFLDLVLTMNHLRIRELSLTHLVVHNFLRKKKDKAASANFYKGFSSHSLGAVKARVNHPQAIRHPSRQARAPQTFSATATCYSKEIRNVLICL